MATDVKRIRIFTASPGDVHEEREALSQVVNELNVALSALVPEKGAVLELVKWETHAYPAPGRVQEVISKQVGVYDIFFGIMWKHFGTPTGVAGSGTEEEYNDAFQNWRETGQPHVMFYFCQKAVPPNMTADDIENLKKVNAFRKEVSDKGLVWDYPDHREFKDIVRLHLINVLGKMLNQQTPREVAERVSALSHRTAGGKRQLEEISHELEALSREYQSLRDSMLKSDARTRKMELLMTRMRTLAPVAYPLLQRLSKSALPGDRLAAIAILQEIPQPEYLDWLADRLNRKAEKAFVGYHAAVALSKAALTLDAAHQHACLAAVEKAKMLLGTERTGSDRYRVLQAAERTIKPLS
jgi:hypothetical protein